MTSGSKLSARDEATVQMLRRRIDPTGRRFERITLEEQWLKNMAYFAGKHHFYVDNGRISDATADIPEHRVLYRVNLTRSSLHRAAAKVLGVNAQYRAVPESGSIRHRNIALTSERLFEHIRERTDWNARVALVQSMYAGICGSGFVKVWYDPLLGERDRFYMNSKNDRRVVPSNLLSAAQMHEKDREGLFIDLERGDVAIENVSTFAVYHDWSSRDKGVAGCHWMGEAHYADRDRVAERFNVDAGDLMPSEGDRGLINYEEAVAFMSSVSGTHPFEWGQPEDKRGERVKLIEMWERPSRDYKRGRRVVYGGGKILVDQDNPYAGDKNGWAHLPYVKQDWSPFPGRFWGSSLVEDLTTPQHHMNSARACLLEFLRVFGRPATFVWSNSGLDPTKQTIDPGGVYTIHATSKPPTYAPVPNLPPEITGVGELCERDLNTIASQSEIDGTKLPGQMRSGEALRQIQGQRDIALNLTNMEAIRTTRDVGRIALTLAQMFYDQKRTLRYLGDDSQWHFTDFTGADLANDLVIVGQPSIVDTLAMRRSEIMDAVNFGVLNPAENPDDRDYVLSALRYNDADQMFQAKLKAQKNQEDEIRSMVADPLKYGEQGYPIMPFEDHATELRVLVDFMYSAEFKALPPMTQSVILMHWQAHAQAAQEQQMQQLMLAESMKGAPGSKGRASQPKAT